MTNLLETKARQEEVSLIFNYQEAVPSLDISSVIFEAAKYSQKLKGLRERYQQAYGFYSGNHPDSIYMNRYTAYETMVDAFRLRFDLKFPFILNKSVQTFEHSWCSLALGIIRGDFPDQVIKKGNSLFIRQELLTSKAGKYATKYTPMEETRSFGPLTVKLDEWPIRTTKNGYFEFIDVNILNYCASRQLVRDFDDDIVERMQDYGLFDKNRLIENIGLISLVAEAIYRKRPDYFKTYIDKLIEIIGGEEGFAVTGAILEDHQILYHPLFNRPNEYSLQQLDIYTNSLRRHVEKYQRWKYDNRPEVIPFDILTRPIKDSDQFWKTVFTETGVAKEMEDLFSGKGKEDIEAVYEVATSERKEIAGLVMLFADALGYDPQKAKKLAAIAQFSRGVIACFDDIQDNHLERRGRQTMVAKEGRDIALNRTMLALSSALKQVIGFDPQDKLMEEQFNSMLLSSCQGDLRSRKLNWKTVLKGHRRAAEKMDNVFSWFIRYIGLKTGYTEESKHFTHLIKNYHFVLKSINDLNDFSKESTHEIGNDILYGYINPFWDQVRRLVPADTREMIERVFAKGRLRRLKGTPSDIIEDPEIMEIAAIGRVYRPEVAILWLKKIYKACYGAEKSRRKAFRKLPTDRRNKRCKEILANCIGTAWQTFYNYTKTDNQYVT